MVVAQNPQLVHLLWHNQKRPHEEQAGQKVKDEQEVQHQQELVYTSEIASEDQFKGFESLPLEPFKNSLKRYCCSAALGKKRL
ncbi:hypothetical protein TNCV_3894651 [Trichonephila clavipes]|nr:hypothetical protein TNCV_3894651 [Trichonephila clavipes]